MEQKLPIEIITEVAHLLPIVVLEDVNRRMADWLASGGKDNDPYMYQQSRFVQNFVHARGLSEQQN